MPASSPKRKSPRRKIRKSASPAQRLSREIQKLSREVKLSRKTKKRSPAKSSVARLSRQVQQLSRTVQARSPAKRTVRRTPRRKLSPEQKLSREINKTINSLTRSSPAALLLGGLDLGSGLGGIGKMNSDHKDALKMTSLSPTLWPGYGSDVLSGLSLGVDAGLNDETLTNIEWYSFVAGLSNAQMTILLKKNKLLNADVGLVVNPYNRLRYFKELLSCCKSLHSRAVEE